jgi:hypothetical protein
MWAWGVPILAAAPATARADDSVGITHETYVEDHGRMTVQTESLRARATLSPWMDLTLRGVYDAISGATPIGAPAINQLTLENPRTHAPVPPAAITGFTRPLDGVSGASPVSQVTPRDIIPLANSEDARMGIDLAAGLNFGPHRLVPEVSYSNEHDYVSYAGALNYSLELNDKNTTLNVGWSHAYDRVLSNPFTFLTHDATKNSDDIVLGVTQLLGPGTLFSANGTFGHSGGYLNDPYRSVVFDETTLDPNARVILNGERRPSARDSEAALLSFTQAITPLNASVEGTYRFYRDSYGIIANTLGIEWFQKFGRHVVVSPSFRYYRQGAAHFYGIQFPGDPANDPTHVPRFYSSDYRLSFLETFTLGLDATVTLREGWELHMGYQRYWMRGLDGQTLQSAYPSAQVYTIGLNVTF